MTLRELDAQIEQEIFEHTIEYDDSGEPCISALEVRIEELDSGYVSHFSSEDQASWLVLNQMKRSLTLFRHQLFLQQIDILIEKKDWSNPTAICVAALQTTRGNFKDMIL